MRGTLLDATRQLEQDVTEEQLPIAPHTADMLLSAVGDPYRLEIFDEMYTVTQSHALRDGVGTITFTARREYMNPFNEAEVETMAIGPNMQIAQKFETVNMDLRRANIPGVRCEASALSMSTFAEANMDGAVFQSAQSQSSLRITSVCMDGASLRDARFNDVVLRNVSLVGVDATGASFHVTQLLDVDITDSNIHPDQFDLGQDPVPFLYYREHSLGEVVEATGLSADELAVRIWAGDVEARDNISLKPVTNFEAEFHHIPQWEMQRLLRESASERP